MYQTYIIIVFRFIRINCFKLRKDKTNTMQSNHRLYKHLFCNFVLFFFVIENLALGGHTWQRHPFSPERSAFVSENAQYQTTTGTQLNGEWILVVWSASATSISSTGLTTYEVWLSLLSFRKEGSNCRQSLK